jgi:hypothetical protein
MSVEEGEELPEVRCQATRLAGNQQRDAVADLYPRLGRGWRARSPRHIGRIGARVPPLFRSVP